MDGQKTNAQVAVVMVPFLAQGHLNQLLHLSHLITSYEITVYYVGSSTHNRQAKLRLHGWDPECSSNIHFHDLKLPPFSSPPPNPDNVSDTYFPKHLEPLFSASLHLRQQVCEFLKELATKFKRIIVVHDSLMNSVVQDVKSIPNTEAYTFLSTSAFTMFVTFWENIAEKPFQLDPDVPRCIPTIEGCFTPEVVKFLDHQNTFTDFQSGALYNTCRVIEGKYVDLLNRLAGNTEMKHFAIGPLNPVEMKARSENCRHGCLEWLDRHEVGSVIYVSFGSVTSLTAEQIRELALGLERSGQRFIWVLRNADKVDIFAETEAMTTTSPQLPQGYEERVKDRGLVVRDWAPQLEILAHPSTGGFMSHCGWNSCLESISMGVPIAAWPMHSDQPKNSVLVTEVLRVGVLVRDWENRAELVTATSIANTVRRLMASEEGAEMRKRAAELGEKVRGSVAKGGTSRLELESFVAYITR